jgi:predicted ATPase
MGRMMFESTKNDRNLLDAQLYDIVDQYDRALELIQDEKEKYQVAELNLEAGRKAKYSSAYKSAELYLTTGIDTEY